MRRLPFILNIITRKSLLPWDRKSLLELRSDSRSNTRHATLIEFSGNWIHDQLRKSCFLTTKPPLLSDRFLLTCLVNKSFSKVQNPCFLVPGINCNYAFYTYWDSLAYQQSEQITKKKTVSRAKRSGIAVRFSYVVLRKGDKVGLPERYPRLISDVNRHSNCLNCMLCLPDGNLANYVWMGRHDRSVQL